MADELEVLAGGPAVVVQVGGREITVTPIRVRELAAFTRVAQPIFAELGAEIRAGQWDSVVLELLGRQAEQLVQLVAIGARETVASVEEMSVADLITLAGAVVAVNSDFFVRAVMPALTQALGCITGTLESGSRPLDS
jgi:hypothetical protein